MYGVGEERRKMCGVPTLHPCLPRLPVPPVVDRSACVQENVLLHFSLSADPAVRDVVFLRPVLGHKDLSDGECRVFG